VGPPRCKNCGAELKEHWKLCPECGTPAGQTVAPAAEKPAETAAFQAGASVDDDETLWSVADDLLENDEYDAAIEECTKILAAHPDSPTAHLKRGEVYYYWTSETFGDDAKEKRLYNLALSDISEAIRMRPDYEEAFVLRGDIYSWLDTSPRAIQAYSEAIRLNPQAYNTFDSRGAAYRDFKKYDEAIKDYTTAIQLAPADKKGRIIFNRGDVYKKMGEEKKAESDYNEACRLDPSLCSRRADMYKGEGKNNKAISWYTKAIKHDPQDKFAYRSRGEVYRATGHLREAIADYDKYIQIDPTRAYVFSSRADVCMKRELYESAVYDYTKAIQLYTESGDDSDNLGLALALHARGVAYFCLENYEAAIRDYKDAIQICEEFYMYRDLGSCHLRTEEYNAAINDFSKAIKLYREEDDVNPEILASLYNKRGLARYYNDDEKNANRDFAKAVELDPANETYRKNLED
jgi:tetratricopeptide (TPR) repeat protein